DHLCPDKLWPSSLRIRPVFYGEACPLCSPKHLVLRVDSFPGLCDPVNSTLIYGEHRSIRTTVMQQIMRILAEHLIKALVSQSAKAGRIAEGASVFEINPINRFGCRIEKKAEFVLALTQRFFHLLAAGNVLCKDENSSHSAVSGSPRTNLPPRPTSAASGFPTVFLGSQGFPLERAAICLFPAIGDLGGKVPRHT